MRSPFQCQFIDESALEPSSRQTNHTICANRAPMNNFMVFFLLLHCSRLSHSLFWFLLIFVTTHTTHVLCEFFFLLQTHNKQVYNFMRSSHQCRYLHFVYHSPMFILLINISRISNGIQKIYESLILFISKEVPLFLL